jgi:hypothetical protein
MTRFFALCVAISLVTAFAGCEKKAEIKKTTTTTTPEGSTTQTDTSKIETSGQNPPPATK